MRTARASQRDAVLMVGQRPRGLSDTATRCAEWRGDRKCALVQGKKPRAIRLDWRTTPPSRRLGGTHYCHAGPGQTYNSHVHAHRLGCVLNGGKTFAVPVRLVAPTFWILKESSLLLPRGTAPKSRLRAEMLIAGLVESSSGTAAWLMLAWLTGD